MPLHDSIDSNNFPTLDLSDSPEMQRLRDIGTSYSQWVGSVLKQFGQTEPPAGSPDTWIEAGERMEHSVTVFSNRWVQRVRRTPEGTTFDNYSLTKEGLVKHVRYTSSLQPAETFGIDNGDDGVMRRTTSASEGLVESEEDMEALQALQAEFQELARTRINFPDPRTASSAQSVPRRNQRPASYWGFES